MNTSQIVALCIIGVFFPILIGTRWMFIARPNRRFTLARIDDAQFYLERGADGGPTLLDEARTIAAGDYGVVGPEWLYHRRGSGGRERRRGWSQRLGDRLLAPLIWNGSRDLVAWGLVHRVEAHAAGELTGAALVARLMKAQSQLEDMPEHKRAYWSKVCADLLEGAPAKPLADEAMAQAILHSLLDELYDARDTKFTNLATQQNKVTWLVLTGLLLLGALASLGYDELILAGAVGGILSRLQRELGRRDVPSDYGLSWSTLFLSPVTGALAGWVGVLLLDVLQKLDVVGLTSLLPDNASLTSPVPALMGVAVLFGVSERLLDKLVQQLTDEITVKPAPAAAAMTAPVTPLPAANGAATNGANGAGQPQGAAAAPPAPAAPASTT